MAKLKVPVTPDDHIRGPANAPVTLVEYGDYECPHCGLSHPIVNAVREQFSGDLRFVFRHFPLKQIHPNAEPAAESARRHLRKSGSIGLAAAVCLGSHAWAL
jgi:protein-disulfide isomerase